MAAGKKTLFLFYAIFMAYLLMNTGIISDDYLAMRKSKGKCFLEAFSPSPKEGLYFLETPVEQLTHYTWYHFFSIDNQTAANTVKILYVLLSFYMISRFFVLYMNQEKALLASFLFIFFPLHDSTAFFFISQYLTLSFAFYLYAYYLVQKNRLVAATVFSVLASFISYGSFPLAFSLFVLCLLRRQIKKGLVILIPNIIYSVYYFFIIKVMHLGTDKFSSVISPAGIAKSLLVQSVTFSDAFLGPSMWLKMYYGLRQISWVSFIVGVLFSVFLYKTYKEDAVKYSRKLVISLFLLILAAFGLFSLSGMYPQLAFNLGDRVTIFGSLLVVYLLVALPLAKKPKLAIFILMVFTILGISDHWKQWSLHQQQVINNIKDNARLKAYSGLVYVCGNQYSRYGPLSHIEFLSEDWVCDSVLRLAIGDNLSGKALNKKYYYKDGSLVDKKYGNITQIGESIVVYDSRSNILVILKRDEINSFINSLPADKRHWIQIIDIKPLKNVLYRLMPRLEYAL